MNTTPPTQLPVPVVAGDSGRREGEPPLVPDDVAPVEEANADDVMEEDDDDPNQYINTAYDDARDNDSGYEHGDDLMLPDLSESKRPKASCKKSLFMRSSQGTPPDVASTQQKQCEGRPLFSPTTLGVVVREGMVGSLPPPTTKQRRRPGSKGSKGARAASISQHL